MAKVDVILPSGSIRGDAVEGVVRFLGIPYAAPPEGALRFAAPAAAQWEGIRDCTVSGAMAPQPPPPVFPDVDIAPLVGSGWMPGSSDYLTLNIWRAANDEAALPVMVFIHGGGFVTGSKDMPIYDGSGFARSGMMCVSINYRLGIEGFLPIPGVPTNLGLRDQIAALRWIKENIGLFGGNPENITVFGESAGAVSIACLLASPLAKGLFRRAILQSGHGVMRREIKVAQRLVVKLAKMLRITADADGFASVSPAVAIDAQERVSRPLARIDLRDERGVDPLFGISRFAPVYGDDVLPEPPEVALSKGASAEVDLLVGTNAEEMNVFTVASGMRDKMGKLLALYAMHKFFPRARALLKAYGMGRDGISPGKAFTDAATDLVFRAPGRRFAEVHRGQTHFYEFEWRSPALGGAMGAAHALEIPFVFNMLPIATGETGLLGPNPPQTVADHIHGLWCAFATNGAAPWPEYTAEERVVYLLANAKTVLEAPLPAIAVLEKLEAMTTSTARTAKVTDGSI